MMLFGHAHVSLAESDEDIWFRFSFSRQRRIGVPNRLTGDERTWIADKIRPIGEIGRSKGPELEWMHEGTNSGLEDINLVGARMLTGTSIRACVGWRFGWHDCHPWHRGRGAAPG